MATRTMVRWDPFRDLADLQEEMHRLVGRFRGDDGVTAQWAPTLDVWETDDAYHIRCDLPGLAPDDVDVSLDQNLLTIRGERRFGSETREESYLRVERRYGTFQRTISLPSLVDADGIQAALQDGVLELTVPKAEQAKPRKIKVGDGARRLTE